MAGLLLMCLLVFSVFAVQNGGACLGGPRAEETFAQFGPSTDCSAGKGGIFAFTAYRFNPEGNRVEYAG